MTSKKKALLLAEAAQDRKAKDVRLLDLRGIASFTDLFVIVSATSARHARTVADAVLEQAHQLGESPLGVEGEETGRWILVDLHDVIVHIFQEEVRTYYDLERLWGDAEPVEFERVAGSTG